MAKKSKNIRLSESELSDLLYESMRRTFNSSRDYEFETWIDVSFPDNLLPDNAPLMDDSIGVVITFNFTPGYPSTYDSEGRPDAYDITNVKVMESEIRDKGLTPEMVDYIENNLFDELNNDQRIVDQMESEAHPEAPDYDDKYGMELNEIGDTDPRMINAIGRLGNRQINNGDYTKGADTLSYGHGKLAKIPFGQSEKFKKMSDAYIKGIRGERLDEEQDELYTFNNILQQCGWSYFSSSDVISRTTGTKGVRFNIDKDTRNACDLSVLKSKLEQAFGNGRVIMSQAVSKYAPEIQHPSVIIING